MRPWTTTLLSLLLAAPAAAAQVPADEIPPEFEEPLEEWVTEREVASSPFHRQRFADVYLEHIEDGRIHAVAAALVATFEALDWGAHADQQQRIVNQLARFLAALDEALHAPGIQGPLDTRAEQNIFLEELGARRHGLDSLKPETLADPSGEDVPGYFGGTTNELLLYEWGEDGESVLLRLSAEEVRQWRLLQNALSNLVLQQAQLVREENVRALRTAVVRWENYLDRGYSQMPWESFANGWLIDAPALGPPDHQWVLLHPTIGFELSVDPLDESRVKEALHVELLGHVWYRGRELEDYWGVSATVSLRDDLDPGIGALVRIRRNWNLGVTWHDVDEDPYLFFSVDLLSFARRKAPEYVARYRDVRARLGLQ
jgi:hypothetical protein